MGLPVRELTSHGVDNVSAFMCTVDDELGNNLFLATPIGAIDQVSMGDPVRKAVGLFARRGAKFMQNNRFALSMMLDTLDNIRGQSGVGFKIGRLQVAGREGKTIAFGTIMTANKAGKLDVSPDITGINAAFIGQAVESLVSGMDHYTNSLKYRAYTGISLPGQYDLQARQKRKNRAQAIEIDNKDLNYHTDIV